MRELVMVRELPTMDFIMREMAESNARSAAPEAQSHSGLFYVFAALQVPTILGGAVVGLFMAPVSLFVSTTEAQAVAWLLIGLIALVNLALGLLALPLGIAAGIGLGKEQKWGKVVGGIAASLAILQFPFGTICGGYLLRKLFRR